MKYVLGTLLFLSIATAQLTMTEAPKAESYGLFGVNNSGIDGNMQVSIDDERVKIVVTLPSAKSGEQYAVALFEGDCGPDRVMVMQLETVPTDVTDPFSSITYTDIPFEQITEGNHFAYIYAGPEVNQANILACGEVGLGANVSTY